MKILITGAAGFIGFHLAKALIEERHNLFCIDNLNSYYDPSLKTARLKELGLEIAGGTLEEVESDLYPTLRFKLVDIAVADSLNEVMSSFKPDIIIHLAAQAGVRYSLENPGAYVQSNTVGFFNILEACRNFSVKKLIYASSSSVYGNNIELPFKEDAKTDSPVSLYAATKKSNELFAYTYSHLFGITTVGLRFFTVYGPFGRPDMAYFSFVKNIIEEKKIRVFNKGNLSRDFTYVDDIVHSIRLLLTHLETESIKGHQVFNIGNASPVQLKKFIETIEITLDKKAIMEDVDMQAGDVYHTYADVSSLAQVIHYTPSTTLEDGIKKFVKWYKNFYYAK